MSVSAVLTMSSSYLPISSLKLSPTKPMSLSGPDVKPSRLTHSVSTIFRISSSSCWCGPVTRRTANAEIDARRRGPSSRHRHTAQNAVDDVVGSETVELGFGLEHDAMTQHRC